MSLETVHVFYAGAQLMKPGLMRKMTSLAINALQQFAPEAAAVEERLGRGAVEDLRIDFEDGFGVRSGEEEDRWAQAAGEFAREAGELPACWGVRLKPMGLGTRERALRTLELVAAAGAIPPVVTLPKINKREEVEALVEWLDEHGWETRVELMVETVYAVGALRELMEACRGRCVALHFGAYDFLSELGVTFPDQTLGHPFCDQARYEMQRAVTGTGVRVVDGVTSLLPLGEKGRAGWELHGANVRRSLAQGFYASWDVHPAQVAARLMALFGYFAEHKAALGERLANFAAARAQATRVGAAFDDAATARGLALFFARGMHCGALDGGEVKALTGLTGEEIAALS